MLTTILLIVPGGAAEGLARNIPAFSETYMAHELKSFIDYRGTGELCYWRSKSGYEVDFIIDDAVAIEVKAKANVSPRDLRGILALKEEHMVNHYVVASLEQRPGVIDGVHVLPWKEFLLRLWSGGFVAQG